MNLLTKAARLKNGILILQEWLGEGGIAADQELAQKRTNTCIGCPLNRPGSFASEAIAKAIKSQVELRNELGLRTNGIKSLHTCQACLCYLPLKVFVPIENLAAYETAETLANYDPNCWVLAESKELAEGLK
jgi:hypothetical protein